MLDTSSPKIGLPLLEAAQTYVKANLRQKVADEAPQTYQNIC